MLTNGKTLKVDGAFLVSGCVNDLGEESERVSGYYPSQPDGSNRPWKWDLMKENARRIVHIGSHGCQMAIAIFFRSYVFGPSGLKDNGSATLRCKI